MSQQTTPMKCLDHLDDSVSSLTQNVNQGMGAVGETAADIEIYMGEQATEMAKGVGTAMNGMGTAMQGAKEGVMGKPEKTEKAENPK